jgi:hypothetical protein
MSKDYEQKVKENILKYAKNAVSVRDLSKVTEYLRGCRFVEALSLNTPENEPEKVILHVINKEGEEDVVEAAYVKSLIDDAKNYRAELAKGMVGNEKNVKEALFGLEKSRKDLGL